MGDVQQNWRGWHARLFDPRKVPLSIAGSFLCVSWLSEDQAFWIRNLRGGDEHTNLGRLLRLALPADLERAAVLHPDALVFAGGSGASLSIAFLSPDSVAIRSRNCPIRLRSAAGKYDYAQAHGSGARVCVARQDMQCGILARRGTLQCSVSRNGLASDAIDVIVTPQDGAAEAVVSFFQVEPSNAADGDLEVALASSRASFSSYHRRWPPPLEEHGSGFLLASYILWSALVPAEGVLTRPAVYMSKNCMNNIWSWDNCFVALGLSLQNARLAFDQMAVIFDAQHESGRLPDFINDRYRYWSFTKPPVHGWAFSALRQKAPEFYTPDILELIVGWLEAQAAHWLSGPAYEGLPAYRHGNDAGWDNATAFSEGGPIVTPDLATFLVLTLDEVADCCGRLGRSERAAAAKLRADGLVVSLLRVLWTGEGFVSRHQTTGKIVEGGKSLLAFMPLLLGQRLPPECRVKLIAALKRPGEFLSDHGLATEALDSPFYRRDGYWRGPIWAPATALLVSALDASGGEAFADELARRFCAMANRSGMAENFDARSGEGLCDPAFAWTSAVYMILVQRLARRQETHIENDFIER